MSANPPGHDRYRMTSVVQEHGIAPLASDIPNGMTIADYRAAKTLARPTVTRAPPCAAFSWVRRRLLPGSRRTRPDLRPYQPAATILRSVGGAAKRRSLVLVEHDVRDRLRRVQADEVEQRERAHGVVRAALHRRVDLVDRADALLVGADRVEHVRHEQAVDDEAGLVLRWTVSFLPSLSPKSKPVFSDSSSVVTVWMTSSSVMTCGVEEVQAR